MDIPLEGQYTQKEIRRAVSMNNGCLFSTIGRIAMIVIGGLLLLYPIMILVSEPVEPLSLLLSMLPMLLGWGLFFGLIWVVPLLQARQVAQSPLLQGTVRGVATGEALELHNDLSASTLRWDAFTGYKASDQVVLLYQDKTAFTPVPRSLFASDDDWQSFQQHVQATVAQKPRRVPLGWAGPLVAVAAMAVALIVFLRTERGPDPSPRETVEGLQAAGLLQGVDARAVDAGDPNAVARLLAESGQALIIDPRDYSVPAPDHYRPLFDLLDGINEDVDFELASLELQERDTDWGAINIIVATIEQGEKTYSRGLFYSEDFRVASQYFGVVNQALADMDSDYRLFELTLFCEGQDCESYEWLDAAPVDPNRLGVISLTRDQAAAIEEGGLLPICCQEFDLLTTGEVERLLAGYERAGLLEGLGPDEIEAATDDIRLNPQYSPHNLIWYFESLYFGFDAQTVNFLDPYGEITRGLAGISRGRFQPASIADTYGQSYDRAAESTFEPVATSDLGYTLYESADWQSTFSFELNGTPYETTLDNSGEWLDLSFLALINRALREQGVDGQFYALEEADQWLTLLFLDAGQLEAVQREGLLAVIPGEESKAVEFGQAIEGEAGESVIDQYGGE